MKWFAIRFLCCYSIIFQTYIVPKRQNVSTFLLFQVGSIPRSPQRRENGSVSNSSPDNGEIQEAEQLLADGSGECRRNNRQGRGILAKLFRILKKLCTTHQFRNVQVMTFFLLIFFYKLIPRVPLTNKAYQDHNQINVFAEQSFGLNWNFVHTFVMNFLSISFFFKMLSIQ